MIAMHWTFQNVNQLLPPPLGPIVLVAGSIVCGAIIGTERERHQKSAGLRTLMLVCLGSAIFTMVSFVFSSTTHDSGRVAAQVVTGIGFLGAGAILHSRGVVVTGMTTAAAIWVAAAIGMTAGAGHPFAALLLALIVRVLLVSIRSWEIHHLGGMKSAAVEFLFDPDHGKTQIRLEQARQNSHIQSEISGEPADDGLMRGRIELHVTRSQFCEFLGSLADLPQIKEIREISDSVR